MSLASYLPSSQFSTIAGSLTLAAVLIIGAQYVTHAPSPAPMVAVEQTGGPTQDWRAALDAIQAQAPSLPPAPSAEVTQNLLAGAKSSNLTDTVARSLLVNLSSANSQGLGADTPTQDNIIASAVAQLPPTTPAKIFRSADLHVVADTKASQQSYGNAVMVALGHHTSATSKATLYAVSQALDTGDASHLDALVGLQAEYGALADELAALPIPQTLVPLHLQALNDLELIVTSFNQLKLVLKDPLQSLQGLQNYNQHIGEVGRVFTSIAESFNKNGILFTKDSPGAAWAVFIAPDTP